MIKTESGELIELRPGDVFQDIEDGEVHRVERVERPEPDVWIVWCDNALIEIIPEDDCYILLHRPFQVGDEVDYYDGVASHWVSEQTDTIRFIVKDINDKLPQGKLRHINPAWRDHSDYNP